jgi:hypothetical protein
MEFQTLCQTIGSWWSHNGIGDEAAGRWGTTVCFSRMEPIWLTRTWLPVSLPSEWLYSEPPEEYPSNLVCPLLQNCSSCILVHWVKLNPLAWHLRPPWYAPAHPRLSSVPHELHLVGLTGDSLFEANLCFMLSLNLWTFSHFCFTCIHIPISSSLIHPLPHPTARPSSSNGDTCQKASARQKHTREVWGQVRHLRN